MICLIYDFNSYVIKRMGVYYIITSANMCQSVNSKIFFCVQFKYLMKQDCDSTSIAEVILFSHKHPLAI